MRATHLTRRALPSLYNKLGHSAIAMKSFRVQPADALGGALGDAVGDATGAIADATGAISTAMHAWTPATFSPPLLGLRLRPLRTFALERRQGRGAGQARSGGREAAG